METLESIVQATPKTDPEIPKLETSVVINKVEKLHVLIKLKLLRIILIYRYFKHPFKLADASNKLVKLRKKVLGEFKVSKIIKVDGRYFISMNGPGLFSKGHALDFTSELNKIYKRKPQGALKVLLLAITNRCSYKCEHCYEWHNLGKQDTLSDESILNIVKRFQERGIGQIQLGGGEPMLRYNTILKILKGSNNSTDFNIVTSGFQFTYERALELKKNGLTSVTISLDHFEPEIHNSFRGYNEAFNWVIEAVKNAKSANLLVNLSLCVTKDFVDEDNLHAYADLAKRLGIAFIWIIEARAAGHYSGKDVNLSSKQINILQSFYEHMNFDPAYADYPGVAYPAYHQRRVGCFGSGNRFLYIDSNGNLKSCPMCGLSHGNAENADMDEAIKSMQRSGCEPFKDAQF